MKDSELIQKVHSGNKEAVGIIIERYYADIYRFCLYMVQTEDDAYDIAQETFLKFMKYGTSYKHHNLKGYLLTIARWYALSEFLSLLGSRIPYATSVRIFAIRTAAAIITVIPIITG